MHFLLTFKRLWCWLRKQFEKPLRWFIDESWEMEKNYHPLYFLARLFERASWWFIDKMNPEVKRTVEVIQKRTDLLFGTLSRDKFFIFRHFINSQRVLNKLKEKLELLEKTNKEALKTIVFGEDPQFLVPLAKRLLLYNDFSVFTSKRQWNKVINNNSLQGIYLEDYSQYFRRDFDFDLVTLAAKKFGLCIPDYFVNINRSKRSFETKVIMGKESLTLGQILFSYIFEVSPLWLNLPENKSINKKEFNSWLKQCLDNIDTLNSNLLLLSPLKTILRTPIEKIPIKWTDPFYDNPLFLVSKYRFEFAGSSIKKGLRLGLPQLDKKSSIIQPLISIDLPFLEKVSLEDLIKARIKKQESFILFRKRLFNAVQQLKQIRPHENPKKIAKDIERDIIQPQLIKIERDIKKIATYKALRMATIITTPLVLGIFIGEPLYKMIMKTFASAGIGIEAIDLLKEMKEVKENPVYFLWKLKRHSRQTDNLN